MQNQQDIKFLPEGSFEQILNNMLLKGISSETVNDILYEVANDCCVMGYDGDGTTHYESFESGFALGREAGDKQVWLLKHSSVTIAWFFIVDNDDPAAALIEIELWIWAEYITNQQTKEG